MVILNIISSNNINEWLQIEISLLMLAEIVNALNKVIDVIKPHNIAFNGALVMIEHYITIMVKYQSKLHNGDP